MIAVIFSGITLLLLIVAVAEQEWVEVKFHDEKHLSRWGLWTLCTKADCNSLDYGMGTFNYLSYQAIDSSVCLVLKCRVYGCTLCLYCNDVYKKRTTTSPIKLLNTKK